MGIPIIGGFTPSSNSPLDDRKRVINEVARLALTYVHKGMEVWQLDQGTYGAKYICKIDGGPTIASDWDSDAPAGATQLDELSDVTSAAITDKFALMADGTGYVGRAIVEADISDFGSYVPLVSTTNYNIDIDATGATGGRIELQFDVFAGTSVSNFTIDLSNGGLGEVGDLIIKTRTGRDMKFSGIVDAGITYNGEPANPTGLSLMTKDYIDGLGGGWALQGTSVLTGNVIIEHGNTNQINFGASGESIVLNMFPQISRLVISTLGSAANNYTEYYQDNANDFYAKYIDNDNTQTWGWRFENTPSEGAHIFWANSITAPVAASFTSSRAVHLNDTGIHFVDNDTSRGANYGSDYSINGITAHGDRWISDIGYQKTHIGAQLVDALVTTPTATEDTFVIAWNDTNSEYELVAQSGGSSPLTTKGDVYTYDTSDQRLGVGINGYVLTADSAEATGLKWAAIPGGGDMLLGTSQVVTALKTFNDTTFALRNVAGDFNGLFTNTNTADRTYTLPDITGEVLLDSGVQTITGTKDFDSGKLVLNGAASGTATLNANTAGGAATITFQSVTGIVALTSDIPTSDNYQSWNLKTNAVQRTTIISGGNLDITAGTNISVGYSAGGIVTINSTFTETSHADVVVDGDFGSNGLLKRTALGVYSAVTDNSGNWDTAYGWGDHALGSYAPASGSSFYIKTNGNSTLTTGVQVDTGANVLKFLHNNGLSISLGGQLELSNFDAAGNDYGSLLVSLSGYTIQRFIDNTNTRSYVSEASPDGVGLYWAQSTNSNLTATPQNITIAAATGRITIKTSVTTDGLGYIADYSVNGITNYGDQWISDIGYQKAHIGAQLVDTLVTTPTATEDGYVISWDDTNSKYILKAETGGGSGWSLTGTATLNYSATGATSFTAVDGITNQLDLSGQDTAETYDFLTQDILTTGRLSTGAANFIRFQENTIDVFSVDNIGVTTGGGFKSNQTNDFNFSAYNTTSTNYVTLAAMQVSNNPKWFFVSDQIIFQVAPPSAASTSQILFRDTAINGQLRKLEIGVGLTVSGADLITDVSAATTNTFTNKSIAFSTNTITGTKTEFDTALTNGSFVWIDSATMLFLSNINNQTSAGGVSIGYGATLAATTKTINLGTNGVSTSITNINIGSSVAGALGTTTIDSITLNLAEIPDDATNASDVILFRSNATGNIEKLGIGSGLSISGSNLISTGGGTQTPWAQDIDGAGFTLTDVSQISPGTTVNDTLLFSGYDTGLASYATDFFQIVSSTNPELRINNTRWFWVVSPVLNTGQDIDLMGRNTSTGQITRTTLSGAGSLKISEVVSGGLSLDGDLVAPGNTMLYGTNGSGVKGWYAQPVGGGNVTKVGTPANNQIGVWTGDGTIEGTTQFQIVSNQLSGSTANSAKMLNQASGTTTPTLLPQGQVITGIGGVINAITLINESVSALTTIMAGTGANVELGGASILSGAWYGATTIGHGVLRLNDVVQAPVGALSSGGGLLYISGTSLNFLDDAGTITDLTAAGGGSVGTDVIWDALGDLVVGSGADTAVRLPRGASLQVLRVNAGGTDLEWAANTGSGDMLLGTSQNVTAAKDFDDGTLILNGLTSGTSILKAAAIAGATTLTLPDTTGILGLADTKAASAALAVTVNMAAGTYQPKTLTGTQNITTISNQELGAVILTITGGTDVTIDTALIPARDQKGKFDPTNGTNILRITCYDATGGSSLYFSQWDADPLVPYPVSLSDETTDLTTGLKRTFRIPAGYEIASVRGSLTTVATGTTLFEFDLKENGVSLFSTRPTIDASELTTETAATASVLSDTTLADDAEITAHIQAIGNTTPGRGAKLTLMLRPL